MRAHYRGAVSTPRNLEMESGASPDGSSATEARIPPGFTTTSPLWIERTSTIRTVTAANATAEVSPGLTTQLLQER